MQKYTFTFDRISEKLAGHAEAILDGKTRQVELKDLQVDGDKISFWEALSLGGNEVRIEYSGRISGNSITFTRKVGEFANEEAVAKRSDAVEEKAKVAPAATSSAVPNAQQRAVVMSDVVDPKFHIYL